MSSGCPPYMLRPSPSVHQVPKVKLNSGIWCPLKGLLLHPLTQESILLLSGSARLLRCLQLLEGSNPRRLFKRMGL